LELLANARNGGGVRIYLVPVYAVIQHVEQNDSLISDLDYRVAEHAYQEFFDVLIPFRNPSYDVIGHLVFEVLQE